MLSVPNSYNSTRKQDDYDFYVVDSATGWTDETLAEIQAERKLNDKSKQISVGNGCNKTNRTRNKPTGLITSVQHGVRANTNRRAYHTRLGTNANNNIAKTLSTLKCKKEPIAITNNNGEETVIPSRDKLDMKTLSEEIDNVSDISYEQELCDSSEIDLHSAAAQGHTDRLAKLLASTYVDTTDANGMTALIQAVHGSHTDCINLLLEAGADANLQLSDGSTVLHQVAFSGNYIILSLLLKHGVTKTAIADSKGRIPIHWAAHAPTTNCISLLLDHDISVIDVTDLQGMTPLMWTAYLSQPDHLKQLLSYGASQAIQDNDGMTAIHWCVNGGTYTDRRVNSLKQLLSIESSRYSDYNGKTVTHYIAESYTPELLSLVLSTRASAVHDIDKKMRTPIHWASACNNPSVMTALIKAGASISARDDEGITALDYALAKDFKECVQLLRESLSLTSSKIFDSSLSTSSLADRLINQDVIDTDKHAFSISDLLLLRYIGTGCYLYKYTNRGKGPKHRRYFWINLESGQLCWSKLHNPANSDIRTTTIIDVRPSASLVILGRKDFDSSLRHQFCFCVLCTHNLLNLIAADKESYSNWVRGIKLYLTLGAKLANQMVVANREALNSIEEVVLMNS
ncbi:hypothetical protein LOD99_2437 [Oopsacas minuta]|uniref:Pleckstrin homology domain-containing protein n=1 Tax=Oopsacas minuta TaxID=111878 RepID=A0AAV7K2I3_9METZ|nr:hypothetical protein LOD99_2437 [Oopsacas minuta]